MDGYPDEECKREKEVILAALQTLGGTQEQEVLLPGDHVEGVIDAWRCATREEKRDMLKMMLEAVYVDVDNKAVVALQIKQAFRPLFRAWRRAKNRSGSRCGLPQTLCMATPIGAWSPHVTAITEIIAAGAALTPAAHDAP